MTAGERADDRAERGRENGTERGPRKPYGKWLTEHMPNEAFTFEEMTATLRAAGLDADLAGVGRAVNAAVRRNEVVRLRRGVYRAIFAKPATEPRPTPEQAARRLKVCIQIGADIAGRPLFVDPKGRLLVGVPYEVPDA